MIQDYCRSQRTTGNVLTVPYTDFRALLRESGGDPAGVTKSDHIQEILRQGVLALLDHLRSRPQLAQQLYDGPHPCWLALTPSTYLIPVFVNRLLRQVGGLGAGLTFDRLREMVRRQAWEDLFAGISDEARLTVQLLAPLMYALTTSDADPSSAPVEQLCEFIDLLRLFGFDACYILVDRVDELAETAKTPQAGVDLLHPILEDLALLELPHLAFKFFLPTEMRPPIEAITRVDRLVFRQVTWSDADLGRLLEARLRAFSDDRISSLSQISAVGLKDIDDRLIEHAVGSPRNLIRLGEFIFSEHCCLPMDERVEINAGDWKSALRQYWADLGLSVDNVTGRVLVAGREMTPDALTERDYAVLQVLYEHAGQLCTRDEIAYHVYGPKAAATISDNTVDQAVSRLRRKIEPNKRPLYIITIPGKGYRLDHARPAYSSTKEEP
jgi:DNA-binding winged helix-turn-helix (wHTH) protein